MSLRNRTPQQSRQVNNSEVGHQYAAVLDAEARDEVFSTVKSHARRGELLSKFTDSRWDLSTLEPNRSSVRATIDFGSFPKQHTSVAKRIAWTWINLDTPRHLLSRKSSSRLRLSPSTIAGAMAQDVVVFLRHLGARGVARLADVSQGDYESFQDLVAATGWGRERKARILFAVTRMWLSGIYLPPPDRLPVPPWEQAGIDSVIGSSTWTAENKTAPIHPETMAATLTWAMRFVDILSDDIQRALADWRDLRKGPTPHTAAEERRIFSRYLEGLVEAGEPLPGWKHRRWVAREYIANILGIRLPAIDMNQYHGIEVRPGAPMKTAILGRLPDEDEPWLDAIDYFDVPVLRRVLATACLVVVSYLSGMRAHEVAELRRGCCTPIGSNDGQPPRFEIAGFEYKTALDERGNRVLGGRARQQPWTVIEPVAAAIKVAEALSDSEYVFDAGLFRLRKTQIDHKPGMAADLSRWVKNLVDWVNDYCRDTGRMRLAIPNDPLGPINIRRFRRTLAWFIYRQPGGRVALGIQYGHLKSMTTDGYGSRVSSGLRGLYPIEETLSLVDRLNDAAERLENGERVSGPAAPRYLAGVDEFSATFAGKQLTNKQMNALQQNPRMRIFDNGTQPLACCYDQAKSLCHPDNATVPGVEKTPDLTRCDPRCGNVARTDEHIKRVRTEIAELEHQMASGVLPEPMRQRWAQRVETLAAIVEHHEKTKVGL